MTDQKQTTVPTEGKREFVGGWATLTDGSRVPLSEEECRAMWSSAERARTKRAADMPDEQSAINAMWSAFERLKELGWSEACYCPKDGTPFDCIEPGSTGIHPGFYSGEWPTGYFMVGEGEWCGPSRPILFKLSPENQAKKDAERAARIAAFKAREQADAQP